MAVPTIFVNDCRSVWLLWWTKRKKLMHIASNDQEKSEHPIKRFSTMMSSEWLFLKTYLARFCDSRKRFTKNLHYLANTFYTFTKVVIFLAEILFFLLKKPTPRSHVFHRPQDPIHWPGPCTLYPRNPAPWCHPLIQMNMEATFFRSELNALHSNIPCLKFGKEKTAPHTLKFIKNKVYTQVIIIIIIIIIII